MKRRGLLFPVLVLFGLWFGAAAPVAAQDQGASSSTILTINQERLFAASLYGERVNSDIEAASATLSAENRRIEADLTAEEKSLTEQRPNLTPEAFRLLADGFDEKVQAIRRAQELKTRELGRRLEEERATYFKLIVPILGTLMKEHGATVILDRRVIFISSEGVDITDEAVRRIDATLGDGVAQPIVPDE
ncbi:MAG: OmpH family outer membrane protein [Marinosulfonomonas sp.]|nr:OmpH family outer membrane protein [Marinosulfonomonas sp.]